jgi:DNA-binding CsgD family transcriptional regulator
MFSLTYDEAKTLSDIIAVAHTDANCPTAWEEILRLLVKSIPCDALGVVFFDKETGKPGSRVIRDLDPAMYEAYEEYYHACDPITPRALKRGLSVFRPADVMSREAYERTEFHNDFQMAFGYQHPMTTIISLEGDRRAQLWLARDSSGHAFSLAEKRILDLLHPHFASAFERADRESETSPIWQALQPSLDRMTTPVLILNQALKLEHMNLAALTLCEDAACRAENALDRIIAAVTESGDGGSHPNFVADPRERGSCVIGDRRYTLAVFPMNAPGQPVYFVVLLADVLDHLRRTLTRSMYDRGLSPREAEVCEMLVRGMTDREIAGALCIAELTVKDHVKSIREKLEITSRSKVLPKLLSY